MAFMVFVGCKWGLRRCPIHNFPSSPEAACRAHQRGDGKHGVVNRWCPLDDARLRGCANRNDLYGNPMISEIELIHLLDGDKAEFPEAALLAASLVRRGWAHRMPVKYAALAHDFIEQGVVSNETTEVTDGMKPRIRFIIEDGKPTIAESIGCPIEVTVIDVTNQTTAIYETHEGESHPTPLFSFEDDDDAEPSEIDERDYDRICD